MSSTRGDGDGAAVEKELSVDWLNRRERDETAAVVAIMEDNWAEDTLVSDSEDWRVSASKTWVEVDVASGSLQRVLKLVDGREYLPFSWSCVLQSRMSVNQKKQRQVLCCNQSRIGRTPYPSVGMPRCHRGSKLSPATT